MQRGDDGDAGICEAHHLIVLTLQQCEMFRDRSDVRDAPRRGGAALEMPRQPRRESSVSAVREVRRDAVSSTTWMRFRGLMVRSTSA